MEAARSSRVSPPPRHPDRFSLMRGHRSRPEEACPDCFAYAWLRELVEARSTHRGTCPSCRRRNRPLVPVAELYTAFDNLISSCYQPDEGHMFERGTPIIDLIQGDWDVFSERLVERDAAGALL